MRRSSAAWIRVQAIDHGNAVAVPDGIARPADGLGAGPDLVVFQSCIRASEFTIQRESSRRA